MSDSGRQIGECPHGYQRWHCESCKMREVADRLAEALVSVGNSVGMDYHFIKGDYLRGGKLTAADAEKLNGVMDAAASALAEYRKAVSDAR